MSRFSLYWAMLIGLVIGAVSAAWGLPLLPYAIVVPFSTTRQLVMPLMVASSAGLLIDIIGLETLPFTTLSLILVIVINHVLLTRYMARSEYVTCVLSILFISGIYTILQYFTASIDIWQTVIHAASATLIGVGSWYILSQKHFAKFEHYGSNF